MLPKPRSPLPQTPRECVAMILSYDIPRLIIYLGVGKMEIPYHAIPHPTPSHHTLPYPTPPPHITPSHTLPYPTPPPHHTIPYPTSLPHITPSHTMGLIAPIKITHISVESTCSFCLRKILLASPWDPLLSPSPKEPPPIPISLRYSLPPSPSHLL